MVGMWGSNVKCFLFSSIMTLGSQADLSGLHTPYGMKMNEPGFHGQGSHGWVETAAQAVKCGQEASGGQ